MTPTTHANLPPTLLLDLDDTILDDDGLADECWTHITTRFAPQVAPVSAAELLATVYRTRDWYWADAERNRVGRLNLKGARRAVTTEALNKLGITNPALVEQIASAYEARRESAQRPLPGALEALERLRAGGIRMGLITNGQAESQRSKVERFHLADYFQVIVIEGEFGCGKPDERVYRHALAALDAAPSETWMVGDNLLNDVLAPQRLGLTGVWVNASGREFPADVTERPARIIRALRELI